MSELHLSTIVVFADSGTALLVQRATEDVARSKTAAAAAGIYVQATSCHPPASIIYGIDKWRQPFSHALEFSIGIRLMTARSQRRVWGSLTTGNSAYNVL